MASKCSHIAARRVYITHHENRIAAMFVFYKALIVVIGIAMIVFIGGRPLFLRFMTPSDYAVRRNVWLALTFAAFLIPNFWLYLLVAAVLILFAAQRDSNPVALYMVLLLTLPPIGKELPTFGIVNQLLFMDHLRFLSLALLLPLALGFFRREPAVARGPMGGERGSAMLPTDVLILLYVLLQIVLLMPYESFTATAKRMILMGTDMLLPYYVLSRACRSRESFREVMAAFVLAALILVPMGVFEMFKGWLLYAGFAEHWDSVSYMNYLTRGKYLRAQVNSGHSIVLGYTFAVAFGFWLSLQTRVASANWRWGVLMALLVGLLVTFARGPWLGAVAIWVVFLRLGPDARRRSAKAIGLLFVVGILAMVSPLGDKIVDNIPFIGSVGSETVEYRQKLAETSWLLILQNPIFGSRNFLAYMEDLRQGQGIIDLVNAYATIALSYGLVGLGLFAGFFGTILARCFKSVRQLTAPDPDFALIGGALVAVLASALVMLFTVNLYMSIGTLTWALAGMGVAYARLAKGVLAGDVAMLAPLEAGPLRMPIQTGLRPAPRSA